MKRSICIAVTFFFLWFGSVKADEKVYHTTPERFPTWSVTGERDGYLFMGSMSFDCNAALDNYLLIVDGKGELVYYKYIGTCRDLGVDFRPQADGLTYWQGMLTGQGGIAAGQVYRLNSSYQETAVYTATDAYLDNHEFHLLPDGGMLVLYYVPVLVGTGGTIPQESKTATMIREFDASGNKVFEWRSNDHLPFSDAQDQFLASQDYLHTNAIEIDHDGNLLLSHRHFNEVTKIDRKTGATIWRLGGKGNQFALTNSTRWFSYQHDIRRLSNGNISLFDNGNNLSPQYSRYVEYAIDEQTKTITQVREIRHVPDVYSFAMGSARNLPNGHVLIGWGSTGAPAASEYNKNNKLIFELSLPPMAGNYRALSADRWIGQPATSPAITKIDGTLYYTWNGATEVVGYRVYGNGKLRRYLPKSGFEVADRDSSCVIRIEAIDQEGAVLGESTYFEPTCNHLFFPAVSAL